MFLITQFLACAAIILYSGKKVARYGDVISEKTGLSGLWIGVVLLAVATSLPELFTGVGSILVIGAPDLTFGNLFGANMYNLFNIAMLDLMYRKEPLLSSVSQGQLLTAVMSLMPLSIAAAGILLGGHAISFQWAGVSYFSMLIFLSYVLSARQIFVYEASHRSIMRELKSEEDVVFKYNDVTLRKAVISYGIFAAVIAGAGIWLAWIGDAIAAFTGIGKSFVGSQLLGLATTLPEITVSIAALRLGAKEMAVANMLGSNLFNIAIIAVNDVMYRKNSIYCDVSKNHICTALFVILMTAVAAAAMIVKPKKKTKLGMSGYAILIVVLFIAGGYINFLINR